MATAGVFQLDATFVILFTNVQLPICIPFIERGSFFFFFFFFFFLSLSLLLFFPMHSCWRADSHNSILFFRLDVWAETVNQVVMCVRVCVCVLYVCVFV